MKKLENVARVERERERESYTLESKGVTLVALVVTIIIMLILAGVALNMALRR